AIVAIADVSFYVRPGSELDTSAAKRGNSVYFPDRVVPMLPERLSADVCSLKAGEDRAALACHFNVGRDGKLKNWRFSRARVRLTANIAYENAQAAIDGTQSGISDELRDAALKPLWDCWKLLFKARADRAPLELDLPERKIQLDEKGRILSVAPRERLDAHRLVEDYMIAANVAAAKALEAKQAPVMYRDHEPPSREKLVALKDYLDSYDIPFALGQVIKPDSFNRLIDKVGDADARPQIMEQILRTQMAAYYGPNNTGHFGLALGSYAHFTSPIRRYADLIVHRSLVGAWKLGPDVGATKLPGEQAKAMEQLGEVISRLERRAMEAERDTVDRYVAAFLSERVGDVVDARITGVQPFGFFATVDGLGGDGLLLARDLGRECYRYEEKAQALIGNDSGTRYRAGDRLELRLVEANPVSGGLRFELPEGKGGGTRPDSGKPRGNTKKKSRRGKPRRSRS
ncbi:MAG: ribonuclease R family protein, partial [Parasphingopyxis sp.]